MVSHAQHDRTSDYLGDGGAHPWVSVRAFPERQRGLTYSEHRQHHPWAGYPNRVKNKEKVSLEQAFRVYLLV